MILAPFGGRGEVAVEQVVGPLAVLGQDRHAEAASAHSYACRPGDRIVRSTLPGDASGGCRRTAAFTFRTHAGSVRGEPALPMLVDGRSPRILSTLVASVIMSPATRISFSSSKEPWP